MPILFDDEDPKLLDVARPVVKPKITDQDVLSATSNGDGTHDGVKLAQWLYEAYTGKPLPRDDAERLVQEGVRRARIRRDQEARG